MKKKIIYWVVILLLIIWAWLVLPNKKTRIAMKISNIQQDIDKKQNSYNKKEKELLELWQSIRDMKSEKEKYVTEYNTKNWGTALGF